MSTYQCDQCQATNVKLWYHFDFDEFWCCRCFDRHCNQNHIRYDEWNLKCRLIKAHSQQRFENVERIQAQTQMIEHHSIVPTQAQWMALPLSYQQAKWSSFADIDPLFGELRGIRHNRGQTSRTELLWLIDHAYSLHQKKYHDLWVPYLNSWFSHVKDQLVDLYHQGASLNKWPNPGNGEFPLSEYHQRLHRLWPVFRTYHYNEDCDLTLELTDTYSIMETLKRFQLRIPLMMMVMGNLDALLGRDPIELLAVDEMDLTGWGTEAFSQFWSRSELPNLKLLTYTCLDEDQNCYNTLLRDLARSPCSTHLQFLHIFDYNNQSLEHWTEFVESTKLSNLETLVLLQIDTQRLNMLLKSPLPIKRLITRDYQPLGNIVQNWNLPNLEDLFFDENVKDNFAKAIKLQLKRGLYRHVLKRFQSGMLTLD